MQNVDSVYDIQWNDTWTYRDVRFLDEQQYSVYNFEKADVDATRKAFETHEAESQRLVGEYEGLEDTVEQARFPLLPAYDQVLKCSHLFNTLDARCAISVAERAAMIQRVRKLAVGLAAAWTKQQEVIG